MKRLLATENSSALLLVRLGLGVVFVAHGCQKVFGWWGGPGLSAAYHGLAQHYTAPLAVLAILAELAGGLGLIFGLLGRVAALGIAVEMIVAAATVHGHMGFFMNWSGRKAGEGFEYHILAIAMAVAIVIDGSGALSFDRAIAGRG